MNRLRVEFLQSSQNPPHFGSLSWFDVLKEIVTE